ncbi:MAG: hypothetical protein IIZ35_03895, partial [Clostridia bacterium]|nr:hypothetical protein [Clostridia bacterium]
RAGIPAADDRAIQSGRKLILFRVHLTGRGTKKRAGAQKRTRSFYGIGNISTMLLSGDFIIHPVGAHVKRKEKESAVCTGNTGGAD